MNFKVLFKITKVHLLNGMPRFALYESVPPQPIWIIPAQFTFKIHATVASNVK